MSGVVSDKTENASDSDIFINIFSLTSSLNKWMNSFYEDGLKYVVR